MDGSDDLEQKVVPVKIDWATERTPWTTAVGVCLAVSVVAGFAPPAGGCTEIVGWLWGRELPSPESWNVVLTTAGGMAFIWSTTAWPV